ncbi:MAG TPA: hypothetical protein VE263_00160 [Candidatus Angelobacter sp.]|nr:hypothetical protein [Candidatus Angelobacter sp.]
MSPGRIDESTDAGFAAADADDDFAVDGQRCHGHAVAGFVIENLGGPAFDPTFQVESDEIAVKSGDKQIIVQNRGAAIGVAEADGMIVGGNRALPGPEQTAGAAIDSSGGVGASDVKNIVDDDGRNFRTLVGKLEGPFHFQLGDILRIDFREW